MKKGCMGSISPRIWKDTGKRFDEKKIYRSILGNYAIEEDHQFLTGITTQEAKEAGFDVD